MFQYFIGVFVYLASCLYADCGNEIFLKEQWKRAEELSHNIHQISVFNEDNALNLYTERGIAYLFAEEYDKALSDFNYVVGFLQQADKTEDHFFGTGLWGRFFCHAYKNLEEKAIEDLYLIHDYFIHNHLCGGLSSYKTSGKSNSPIEISPARISNAANFENPQERISPRECKERVVGTANVIRILVAKIKSPALIAAAEYAISELERACCNCCDREHWTDCLGPIVNAWNYVKECMNKGAAIAPRVIWPGK